MTLFWLSVLTGSRLFVCVPLWVWCWWRRPRGMVWVMTAVALWFIGTDWLDGGLARRSGLETRLGFWLDRLGDLFGALAVLSSLVLGTREAAARRRSPPRVPSPPA